MGVKRWHEIQTENLKAEFENSEGAHNITLDMLMKDRAEISSLKERAERMAGAIETVLAGDVGPIGLHKLESELKEYRKE